MIIIIMILLKNTRRPSSMIGRTAVSVGFERTCWLHLSLHFEGRRQPTALGKSALQQVDSS